MPSTSSSLYVTIGVGRILRVLGHVISYQHIMSICIVMACSSRVDSIKHVCDVYILLLSFLICYPSELDLLRVRSALFRGLSAAFSSLVVLSRGSSESLPSARSFASPLLRSLEEKQKGGENEKETAKEETRAVRNHTHNRGKRFSKCRTSFLLGVR